MKATVTDTNHKPQGTKNVKGEFVNGKPSKVEHKGATYYSEFREGQNIATGRTVHLMVAEGDERLWITTDGSMIWED